MDDVHRHRGSGRALVFLVWVFALLARLAPAHAEDRVAALTKMLASRSDKTRLAAVLALAKLGNRSVEQPLVTALGDRSIRVRGVAASALGRLGCQAALTKLRAMASDDSDAGVREAANNAVIKIAAAPRPVEPAVQARMAMPPHPARADEPHPDLYLLVNASADDSPGTADKVTRKTHAEVIKRVLVAQLASEASVTSLAADAKRWGLAERHIDLAVTKLDVVKAGGFTEVCAELRLAISDDHGKMLSFLSGGAKVQVPTAKFDMAYLPALRREALENAMRGMFRKLLAHLRNPA